MLVSAYISGIYIINISISYVGMFNNIKKLLQLSVIKLGICIFSFLSTNSDSHAKQLRICTCLESFHTYVVFINTLLCLLKLFQFMFVMIYCKYYKYIFTINNSIKALTTAQNLFPGFFLLCLDRGSDTCALHDFDHAFQNEDIYRLIKR